MHLFQKGSFSFGQTLKLMNGSADSDAKVCQGVPSLSEFEDIWTAWDTVTLTMIPEGGFLEKPISLRHPYIFYIGHIPAFADIQVSRCIGAPLTSPAYFAEIFERGIDPDMEDTSIVNPHSVVPDTWPDLNEILPYRDSVRDRIRNLLKNEKGISGKLARVLWYVTEANCDFFF